MAEEILINSASGRPAVAGLPNPVPTYATAPHAVAVATSDSTDLPNRAAFLYCTVTGNVVFVTTGGETVTLTGIAANTVIPFSVARVRATGTTATVLACY